VSFCDREERGYLKDIERLIKKTPAVRTDHPDYAQGVPGQNTPADQRAHSDHHNRPASERNGSRRKKRRERPSAVIAVQPAQGKSGPRKKKFAHRL
jgi:ATP-dependent RNA helicase RhlE